MINLAIIKTPPQRNVYHARVGNVNCVQVGPNFNFFVKSIWKEMLLLRLKPLPLIYAYFSCWGRESSKINIQAHANLGPTAEECKLCYHVSIFQEGRMTCLPECPESHYQRNDSTCEKCHDACYKHGWGELSIHTKHSRYARVISSKNLESYQT